MLEQDTCCISMVHWQFSQLQRSPVCKEQIMNVPKRVQKSILASIREKGDFLHTDTMGVSFLLDQTKTIADFVGMDLAESVVSVTKLARRIGLVSTAAEENQLASETSEFYLKKERWSPETRATQEKLSPMAWWDEKCNRTADDDDYYPLLALLAARIYTIPTSSASSERSWSIHDFIHTKRRNRLDAGRVEKLVFIYCNAGSKDAKTNIFYRVGDESESDDGEDGEDDKDTLVDSNDDSEESSGEFENSNSYSYDGSEEQKSEC